METIVNANPTKPLPAPGEYEAVVLGTDKRTGKLRIRLRSKAAAEPDLTVDRRPTRPAVKPGPDGWLVNFEGRQGLYVESDYDAFADGQRPRRWVDREECERRGIFPPNNPWSSKKWVQPELKLGKSGYIVFDGLTDLKPGDVRAGERAMHPITKRDFKAAIQAAHERGERHGRESTEKRLNPIVEAATSDVRVANERIAMLEKAWRTGSNYNDGLAQGWSDAFRELHRWMTREHPTWKATLARIMEAFHGVPHPTLTGIRYTPSSLDKRYLAAARREGWEACEADMKAAMAANTNPSTKDYERGHFDGLQHGYIDAVKDVTRFMERYAGNWVFTKFRTLFDGRDHPKHRVRIGGVDGANVTADLKS